MNPTFAKFMTGARASGLWVGMAGTTVPCHGDFAGR